MLDLANCVDGVISSIIDLFHFVDKVVEVCQP